MVITRPKALQGTASNIQVRRSTRTSDRRIAEAALPNIASAIYAEFDTAISNLPKPPPPPLKIHFLTAKEQAMADPFAAQRMLPPLEKPKDPATKLSRFIPIYTNYLAEHQIGDHKERRTKHVKCEEFMSIVGDIHLEDIKKIHAYRYAEWLNDKGLANKTIKSAISRVSMMLVRAEQIGIIENNPFNSIALANYGRTSQSYLPFSPDEMKAIFAQEMPSQERLALTLLATTGARLDEIALLEWTQIKTEHGITFIDFRSASKLKNAQSRRVVPLHSKIAPLLEMRGMGRIFNYPKDKDGKAQNAAGKRLSVYVKNVTDDPRKVVHSLRGTFKDMLKDSGVTPSMVEQLENGEVILSEIADSINSGQVSTELNDRLTGHAMKDVAGKYGLGHALITRAAAIEKMALSFLPV